MRSVHVMKLCTERSLHCRWFEWITLKYETTSYVNFAVTANLVELATAKWTRVFLISRRKRCVSFQLFDQYGHVD